MWLHKISYMFLNCWNVLRREVLLKVSRWPHFTQNLRCWYSIPVPAAGQATITIFLNVPSSVSHQDPPHLFLWKYGESTKFLTHFLLANQISGVLYLSFHSKDVLLFFFYATLLLLFPLWQLRSCWAECLGSACSTRFKVECGRKTVWTNPIIHVFRFLVLQLEGKANPTVKCVGRVKSINFLKS